MMNNAQLATASLNDIVFDGRNRQYGAYELRALYQRHVTRALVIAIVMCALLITYPLVARMLKGKTPFVKVKPPIENILIAPPLDPIAPPPPPIAPPPVAPPAQPPVAATVRFTPLEVAPDNEVTEKVPEQDELQNTHISTITSEGESTSVEEIPLEEIAGPTEVAGTVTVKPYTWVEQMPQLPGGGGTAAIVAAIQRAVKYPGLALRNGIEGKVFVSFTVNPKGDVVDVAVVKGLGYGLDEETMRAINTLPKFIPGKQNGREVSVSFTVPITFKIQ